MEEYEKPRTVSEEERNELIKEARKLIRWDSETDYESDQMLRRTQPPLVKAPMTDLEKNPAIELPKDFSGLDLETDLVRIFFERESRRVYSEERISLTDLSFLLWSTQGIKSIRGKRYATLRTVPSGGARHPFETYFLALHVEGLKTGLYHYLPMDHSIELLQEMDLSTPEAKKFISDTMCGQRWVEKASVIFYYSIIPYRGEWRYSFSAHRVMMMDIGHVSENMYIAATAMGLGACGIGAVDCRLCDEWIGLDGEEEYAFYGIPVGTLKSEDKEKEGDFYAFLKEEEHYYE